MQTIKRAVLAAGITLAAIALTVNPTGASATGVHHPDCAGLVKDIAPGAPTPVAGDVYVKAGPQHHHVGYHDAGYVASSPTKRDVSHVDVCPDTTTTTSTTTTEVPPSTSDPATTSTSTSPPSTQPTSTTVTPSSTSVPATTAPAPASTSTSPPPTEPTTTAAPPTTVAPTTTTAPVGVPAPVPSSPPTATPTTTTLPPCLPDDLVIPCQPDVDFCMMADGTNLETGEYVILDEWDDSTAGTFNNARPCGPVSAVGPPPAPTTLGAPVAELPATGGTSRLALLALGTLGLGGLLVAAASRRGRVWL